MPGISGIEVCRFLRAGARSPPAGHPAAHDADADRRDRRRAGGGGQRLPGQALRRSGAAARVDALVRWNGLLERAQKAEASVLQLLEHAPDPLISVNRAQPDLVRQRRGAAGPWAGAAGPDRAAARRDPAVAGARPAGRGGAHVAAAGRHRRSASRSFRPPCAPCRSRGRRRLTIALRDVTARRQEGVAPARFLFDHRARPALAAGRDADAHGSDAARPPRRAVGRGDRRPAQDGRQHAAPGGAHQRLPGFRADGRGGAQDGARARRPGRAADRRSSRNSGRSSRAPTSELRIEARAAAIVVLGDQGGCSRC